MDAKKRATPTFKQIKPKAVKTATFKQIKPKAVKPAHEQLIRTSTLQPDASLPLVVEPNIDDLNVIEWAKVNREWVEAQLYTHGGLLFRGVGLNSSAGFEGAKLPRWQCSFMKPKLH